MQIVEVKQNWPSDLLQVDLTIGNICNYQCWYCFPGCNTGTIKWPEFDVYVNNLSALLDYYLNNTHKRKFDIRVMGGEVTHWKRFTEFIAYFKTRYNCIFTLTTNGSKDLDWWTESYRYLDYVIISTHHQFCDATHIRNVADFLYEKNVIVSAVVLMDPFAWSICTKIVDSLKKSKHRWSIRYLEIIHDTVSYTDEQKKYLKKVRARSANLFWFLRNNKSFRSRVKVIDDKSKTHKFTDSEIVLRRLNNFHGWDCNLGIDWIAVKMDGSVSGICSNPLFKTGVKYNIFDADFADKFQPEITTSKCQMTECWCMFEANMPKRIIPIKEVK